MKQPSSIATFVGCFVRQVDALSNPKLPDEHQLLTTLGRCKSESSSRFERLCREVVPEILATTEDWSAAQVAAADAILSSAGALTLTDVRSKSQRKLVAVLRKGALKSDAEYELVRSHLDDCTCGGSQAFRAALEQLLLDYESRGSGHLAQS